MLLLSIVAWPATQLTIARSEPPFTLGLSWAAFIQAMYGVVCTLSVRVKQDEANDA